MKRIVCSALALLCTSLVFCQPVFACDICALYSSRDAVLSGEGDLRIGVVQRYTRYEGSVEALASLDESFRTKQTLDSHITQILVAYQLRPKLSLELNAPFIYREYRRVEDGDVHDGEEYGLGDASLLARFALLSEEIEDRFYRLEFFAGLKLPTGDYDRLREELDEDESEEISQLLHGGAEGTLVSGADLALGSGSFDFPLGVAGYLEIGRFFVDAEMQAHLRTEGGYDFRYGNSLFFDIKAGLVVLLEHAYSLSLAAKLSADYKDEDELAGDSIENSDEHFVFLGPELRLQALERFNAFCSWQFVLHDDDANTGVQPEGRALLGLSYRF